MLGVYSIADMFTALAVTSLHVGAGRNPGVVDLPIVRNNLDLPYIPASALKGSIKSACLLMHRSEPRRCERVYGWDIRVRRETPENPYVSPVAFTDAHILLFPVRVETEEGVHYGYAAGEYNLRLLYTQLGLLARLDRGLEEVKRVVECVLERGGCGGASENLVMNGVFVPARRLEGGAAEGLRSLIPGAGEGSAQDMLSRNIYILNDDDFKSVVESGIIRVTRVRLNYRTKTVEHGALWTEEYIPELTVFWFFTLYRDTEAEGGSVDAEEARRMHHEVLEKMGYNVAVGGRETIGKGLILLNHVNRRE